MFKNVIVFALLTAVMTAPVLGQPLLDNQKNNSATSLQGAWELQKAKWGDMKEFLEEPRIIIKTYTKGHFFFIYNKDGQFDGAGGGTYTATDKKFSETLTHFYWDAKAAGTTQSFEYKIEDQVFHQFGKLNSEKYSNYTIDEYYKKVSKPAPTNPLVGVWEITEATHNGQPITDANDALTFIKIFTPTHFYAASFNTKTGAFDHATYGTYTLRDNQLSETIIVTSRDQEAGGRTFTFEVNLKDQAFVQSGKINTPNYPNLKIVEQYKRLE